MNYLIDMRGLVYNRRYWSKVFDRLGKAFESLGNAIDHDPLICSNSACTCRNETSVSNLDDQREH